MTSLKDAVINVNLRMLNACLTGPCVSCLEKDQALLLAVKQRTSECVQCLLKAGADITMTDPSGNSLLILSVSLNDPKTTRILLDFKCSPNFKGSGRCTSLHIAAKHGYDDCLEYLVDFGANVNSRDSTCSTPLIHASKNKGYIAMRSLIEANCEINAVDNDGRSALHYASQRAMGVQHLLNAGANPNICDKDNNTPLMMAATEGFDKVVSLLTAAGCDVNIANRSSKKTPLHILALKGHAGCIEDLILRGADVNMLDNNDRTPLWYATKNNRKEVVKLLLKANSKVDLYQCSSNATPETCPVRLAFENGLVNIIQLFILTGFDSAHVQACVSDGSIADDYITELSSWLQHGIEVMSLRGICRKWIRHHLGNMFYHDLISLPVPDKIRQYLLMKELDEI